MSKSRRKSAKARGRSGSAPRPTLYNREKLDARVDKVPPAFREMFRQAYVGARKLVLKSRDEASPPGLMDFIDALSRQWEADNRPACRAGCAWCCQQDVLMAPFEFDAVRDAIEAGGLQSIVRANLASTETGPTIETEGRLMPVSPCPLLDNDRCMVYAARPISCRTQFAMDAAACRRAFEAARSGEGDATYQRAGDPAVIGIAAREAVEPARRIFLRDALRDYLK